MTFKFAKCEVCLQFFFSEDEVVAYLVRGGGIEVVSLRGQEPWAGVRCACKRCVRTLGIEVGMNK